MSLVGRSRRQREKYNQPEISTRSSSSLIETTVLLVGDKCFVLCRHGNIIYNMSNDVKAHTHQAIHNNADHIFERSLVGIAH